MFTTQSTFDDVLKNRDVVLPGLPVPAADFTSRPELVFNTDAKLGALLGANNPHDHVQAIATGYYGSARFQTHDPDGDGALGDLPNPPGFVTCLVACETTDERFTRDGSGTPIVIDTPQTRSRSSSRRAPRRRAAGRSSSSSTASAGSATRWSASARPTRGPRLRLHRHRRGGARLPVPRLQAGRIVLAGHGQQLRRHGGARRVRRRLVRRLQRELPHGEPGLLPGLPQLPRYPRQLPPDLRRPDVARTAAARALH